MSKCINCSYFLNCSKATGEKEECDNYIYAKRIIDCDKEQK